MSLPPKPVDDLIARVYRLAKGHLQDSEDRQLLVRLVDELRATVVTETRKPTSLRTRKPSRSDCDSAGRCWWGEPETTHLVYELNPLDGELQTTPAAWYLRPYHPSYEPDRLWLPYWALPAVD